MNITGVTRLKYIISFINMILIHAIGNYIDTSHVVRSKFPINFVFDLGTLIENYIAIRTSTYADYNVTAFNTYYHADLSNIQIRSDHVVSRGFNVETKLSKATVYTSKTFDHIMMDDVTTVIHTNITEFVNTLNGVNLYAVTTPADAIETRQSSVTFQYQNVVEMHMVQNAHGFDEDVRTNFSYSILYTEYSSPFFREDYAQMHNEGEGGDPGDFNFAW